MTREAFARAFDVSRGTLGRFDAYRQLLIDGQSRANLVGAATIDDFWRRHVADSAQLLALAPAGAGWIDLGAGAGFPGLVLAILGAPVELVEATGKKVAFLEAVIESLALVNARVHHARIESMAAAPRAVITARALAPLARLFDWGARFAASSTMWVLPKGSGVERELAEARADFRFEVELRPSITSATGRIVLARGVERR